LIHYFKLEAYERKRLKLNKRNMIKEKATNCRMKKLKEKVKKEVKEIRKIL
jgi:hypothetical protein